MTTAPGSFDHLQFDDAYPPGIERSAWHIARHHIIGRAFSRYVTRDEHVLEVGCGKGIVTRHLRAQGYDITGTDLGTPADVPLTEPYLLFGCDALALGKDLRDRITVLALFDVVEHIEDPAGFLRSLMAACANARTVVITVPALAGLWSTFDTHFGHYRRYTRAGLRKELAEAGLRPVHDGYFFHALAVAIGLNNLLRGRRRNIRFQAPARGMASLLHTFAGAFFSAEARIVPRGIPGSSLLCVAHRDPSCAA